VVSTACSSSAKVFATANRYINMGVCDAAIVGGVDSLCLTTLLGFNSLELVSSDVCRPWDTNRKGINIGEAAGFAIVEKTPSADSSIGLLGYGESSDAYHMSTPHPQGQGAARAMQAALSKARLSADQVDYVNLHGTATKSNDSSEDHAVTEVFGTFTPCSSTKGFIGHTLGAAGISESIICMLAMDHNFLPLSLNTNERDASLTAQIVLEPKQCDVNITMTNSFGFGGNNCSLVFGKLS
jgi:3-oxoacyl-[acyl-carrier-protein] synthase-1